MREADELPSLEAVQDLVDALPVDTGHRGHRAGPEDAAHDGSGAKHAPLLCGERVKARADHTLDRLRRLTPVPIVTGPSATRRAYSWA